MSRVEQRFNTLQRRGEGALLGYLMAGDPNPSGCQAYARALLKGGVDLLELGIPFSDPVADGPTIQAAGVRALSSGATPGTVLEMVRALREVDGETPIVFMTYYNPIFAVGEERFLKSCLDVGVDGVIVPDLPAEEAKEWVARARRFRVDTIFLVTPETDETRLAEIARQSTGFLYLASRYGVTGAETEVGSQLAGLIRRVRRLTPQELPLAVGFGISEPGQVRAVIRAGAQGAIVGSALVRRVAQGDSPEELAAIVRQLKAGTRER